MIEHSPVELDKMLDAYLHRASSDERGAPTTAHQARELRRSLGLTEGPIILSGHQPIFFHPGILIKDCLVQALVKRRGGTAATLILDTDQGSIDLSWPARSSRGWAARRSISLGEAGHIAAAQRLSSARKESLRRAINDSLMQLSRVLAPHAAQRARPYLLHLQRTIDDTDDLVEFTTSVRTFHAERQGWQMRYLRASELIRAPAFEFFAKQIFARPDEFRRVFNETLTNYRKEHDIRNHAQPFPDLKEDELPFWLLVGDRRLPLSGAVLAREAKDEASLHTLFNAGHILPRAITLSLFLRMFVCDLFVHGTGGGRYDRVTEKVIEHFFCCQAAPHTVATATLHLEPRADYPLDGRSLAEIASEERSLQFDPVRLLPASCSLHGERQFLIELRQGLGKTAQGYALPVAPAIPAHLRPAFGRRVSGLLPLLLDPRTNPPTLLHREFQRLHRTARVYLRSKRKDLERERARQHVCSENQRLFDDRSLPFFFYDVAPLTAALRDYTTRATG